MITSSRAQFSYVNLFFASSCLFFQHKTLKASISAEMGFHSGRMTKKGLGKNKVSTSLKVLFFIPIFRISCMGYSGRAYMWVVTQASNGSRTDKEKGISERGLILFYGYRSSVDFSWLDCKLPQAGIMSVLLSRDKIRTSEWKLLGIRFLLSVKEEVPHNEKRLTVQ